MPPEDELLKFQLLPKTQSIDLGSVLSVMQTALMLVDLDRRVDFINKHACILLGCTSTINAGLPLDELLSACGVDVEMELSNEIHLVSTRRARLADGRVINIKATRLPEAGWVLTLDDISSFVRDAELARSDPLTGLANRGTMETEIMRLLAANETLALFFLDLDRFKVVNDCLGHQSGDALLRNVAERLLEIAGEGDLVARLGGDEFAIVKPGIDSAEEAKVFASRMVEVIGRTYVIEDQTMNIGASVGVVLAPADGSNFNILLRNADLALYRAKEEGRGRFRFFDSSMDRRMQDRRAMEIDLRRALALQEFRLVYQPQFQVHSTNIIGFEALLRWETTQRGLVAPLAFIPIAEETGLIIEIGAWVLCTACNEAASWDKAISIAVNVSPLQLRDGRFFDTVIAALAQSCLDPERLELEITESALLEDTDAVVALLHKLRAMGIRIAMDDFGTGYSSLSYLQKFPFDKIKIDQSFIQGIMDNPKSSAIIRAVVAIGASLGITTIAEGVETPEQFDVIQAEGCCEVQGYLTGRPMSAAEALVAQQSSQTFVPRECKDEPGPTSPRPS